MNTLGIDIETFSEISLKESGMHKYIAHDSFDIMLISYSINDGEVKTIALAEDYDLDQLDDFLYRLQDPDHLKTAWNAQFERECLKKFFNIKLPIREWDCTMIRAAMAGWPTKLDEAAKAMKLEQGKLKEGRALVKLFGTLNKQGERTFPRDNWMKWLTYKEYNKRDVEVEQAIRNRLYWFRMPPLERRFWWLDQKINNRGIMLDQVMFENAISIYERNFNQLTDEAKNITGIANPNSVSQLKNWIEEESFASIPKLGKEEVKELIKKEKEPHIKRVLEIRQQLAKTSVKKYIAMKNCIGTDERARGLLQFYGANKTGRWAARLIQIHNLPKNKMDNLHEARRLARLGDLEGMQMIFENIPDVMSQLIRTAFIPSPGNIFGVSDFSAIEARVLAWLAGEDWRLQVFRGDGKIYEASGARMFKTTIEKVAADRDGLRFKAKTAELALGYQGGVGALNRMETLGLKTGLKESEKKPLVDSWRAANPKIVQFWWNVEEAAIEALQNPGQKVKLGVLFFMVKNNTFFIQLPSGRLLCYVEPQLKERTVFGNLRQVVTYKTINQKNHQWLREDTYGGKLVENIVQGVSRDLLANAMLKLNDQGFIIVMHVHDEVVFECLIDEGPKMLKKAGEIMSQNVSWAQGLPLKAESFLTPYYIKQ